MSETARSSDDENQIDDTALAILVACQHRGVLTLGELQQLLSMRSLDDRSFQSVLASGHLIEQGNRYAVTADGRRFLDNMLESIEGQLTPDAPEYERRFRRESPSLPFEANTIWAEAICVNVQIEPDALRPLIPTHFELDLYNDKAFISLTASRLKDFGMGRIPRALRMNFYQSTYRAHVTFTDYRGRKMRGCYFVRSETNSHIMSLTANLLPEFKAHHCGTFPILMAHNGKHLVFSVDSGDDPAGKVVLVLDDAHPLNAMPESSIFPTIQDSYDFIVDFYDDFSYDPDTDDVFILSIDRGDWDIRVLETVDCYLGYFEDGPFPAGSTKVDSVFYFRNTPYRWLPLVKERIRRKPS